MTANPENLLNTCIICAGDVWSLAVEFDYVNAACYANQVLNNADYLYVCWMPGPVLDLSQTPM